MPDVMTLAKGLGGGLPIGACMAFGPTSGSARGRAATARTFGGNPAGCAAALAVLDTIEKEGLLDHGRPARRAARRGRARGPATRWSPGCAGAGLLLGHRAHRPTCPPPWRTGPHRAGLPGQRRSSPTRCGSPRRSMLTAAQVDDFVAALPALLDGPEASA